MTVMIQILFGNAITMMALCLLLQYYCPYWMQAKGTPLEVRYGCILGGISALGVWMATHAGSAFMPSFHTLPLLMGAAFTQAPVAILASLISLIPTVLQDSHSIGLNASSTLLALCLGLGYQYLRRDQKDLFNPLLLIGFGLMLGTGQLSLQWIWLHSELTTQRILLNSPVFIGILPSLVVTLGWLLHLKRPKPTMLSVEQETPLAVLLEAIPDTLLILDQQGYCLELRPTCPSIPPFSAHHTSEALGQHLQHLFPTRQAKQFELLIQKALASPHTQYLDYSLPLETGTRFFEGRAHRVHLAPDDPPAVAVLIREVTQRLQIEQEQRVAAIAFESQQGMLIADAENQIIRVNQAFCQITGYSAEDVIGQSTRMLSSGLQPKNLYQAMWYSILNTGSWQGELQNRRKTGEIYPAWVSISAIYNPEGLITHYVAAQTDISQQKAAEDQIHRLAFYDPLTGLPNRRLLFDRLQQALGTSSRTRQYAALMMFDLDNFKNINDRHGHPAGDRFLCEVASRLTDKVRSGDTVARLGGDEFVIVLEGLKTNLREAQQHVSYFAERILHSLSQPYALDDLILHSSASIGIALFRDPASDLVAQEAEELMKRADIAMYEAKQAGKNRLRFFDPQMQDLLNRRLGLEEELRTALEEQQLVLYFQPQFDDQHQLIGAEVLVRWQHPIRGLLLPGEFMDSARRAGLTPALDRYVLQQACYQLARWVDRAELGSLVIAVNISASLLYQPDFVEYLSQILLETGANPHQLKLELTESLLLDDMPLAAQRMDALRTLGIRFSIDDFGTGYSSMLYLHRLPLDQLKIDRTFVQSLPNDDNSLAIIRAICALGNSLGLEVLAEGVEKPEQRQTLTEAGCQNFQGYLFGYPLPADRFEQQLAQSARTAHS